MTPEKISQPVLGWCVVCVFSRDVSYVLNHVGVAASYLPKCTCEYMGWKQLEMQGTWRAFGPASLSVEEGRGCLFIGLLHIILGHCMSMEESALPQGF